MIVGVSFPCLSSATASSSAVSCVTQGPPASTKSCDSVGRSHVDDQFVLVPNESSLSVDHRRVPILAISQPDGVYTSPSGKPLISTSYAGKLSTKCDRNALIIGRCLQTWAWPSRSLLLWFGDSTMIWTTLIAIALGIHSWAMSYFIGA